MMIFTEGVPKWLLGFVTGCFHFIREKDLERNTSKDEMVARYAAQQAVEQEQQEAIDVESEVVVTMPPIIKEEAH